MVDIYKLKFTVLQQEILRFLFIKAGMTFNARRLARHLKVSQTAVSKALPLLEKDGLVKVRKDRESGRLSIELNRDNPRVIALKRVENLKLLYESGLAGFLFDSLPGATIILFGSYSMGEDTTNSDIDIAIIGTKEKYIDLKEFEDKIERSVNLNFYGSLKGMDRHLRNNVIGGILLSGGIDL